MDVRKAFRPARGLPMPGNENNTAAKQTSHQRNKSSITLSDQPGTGTGALQVAAKRTAFADRSNTSKVADTRGSDANMGKGGISNATAPRGVGVEANAKENDSRAYVASKDAPGHKAQRPSSKNVSSLPSAGNGLVAPFQLAGRASHLPSQPLAKPAKRASTMVYNDNQKATISERPQHVSMLKSAQEEPVASRQPRHHQSQPALRSDPKSQQQKIDANAAFANTKLRERYSAEDEASEALYLDAVEELSSREQCSVGELAEGPPDPLRSLPDPIDIPKANTKMVDLGPNFLPIQAPHEDIGELSDYDDEDYYDDQGYTTAHSYRSRGDNTTGGATMVMFPPKLSKRGLAEIEDAKEIVESKRSPAEIEEESWDISMVAEYGDEIFAYMRDLEISLRPNPHYMDIQAEIQWSMRGILMDWVVQVHRRFGLLPETLFLTVNYIDRFLSYKIVSLGKLQLVGATAVFVAAKYEEINCPSVQEIVYMVDGAYSVEEILKAERFMLSMLNFELGWPGPMSFLRRISKADDYELETRTLAKYFLEVTIMDERFVATPPSYIAAGAHCLSRFILDKGDWTPDHVYYSGYTYTQLKPLIGIILDCCRLPQRHHAAVYEKYCDKRYKRAARFVEGELNSGFCLPFQQAITFPISFETYDDLSPHEHYAASHAALKMPIPSQG